MYVFKKNTILPLHRHHIFLADPPLVVSSRFTHVRVSVRPCVCGQLTKLFNIFGSG